MIDLQQALAALEALGRWSVGAVWLPVAVWTVGAGLVLLALRRHALAPHAEARVLAAALWSLPLGLALGAAAGAWLPPLGALFGPSEPLPTVVFLEALPALGPAPVAPETAAPSFWAAWPWAATAGGLLLAALALAAVRVAQYARLRWQLAHLPTMLGAHADAEAQAEADALSHELGLRRPVRLLVTPRAVPPMTYGWCRPTVVVPKHLLADGEMLRLALLHELYHVRRRDYLWRSGERVLGCAFAAHPLVAVLRRRLDAAREEACDAAVLERPGASTGRYAALIYRFLQPPTPVPAPLALGMADARTIKRRLEAMKLPSRRATQLSLLAALTVLTCGTFFVACSAMDPLNIDESDDLAAAAAGEEDVFVVVEEMPVLEGGLQSIQQQLRYPQLAKDANVEGRVIVQFVIDEEGRVTDPQVIKGVGSGLDEEALRVVREATFTPGKQRGQAVPVKMSLPITFKLREGGAAASPLSAFQGDPLLFVDGEEVTSVDHVDPSRIEHVEVLKGEQAVARYGARAADGVVLITTGERRTSGGADGGTDRNRTAPSIQITGDGLTLDMNTWTVERGASDEVAVRARVLDTSGAPLAGANVQIIGTPYGAATDADGWFTLRTPRMYEPFDLEVRHAGGGLLRMSLNGRGSPSSASRTPGSSGGETFAVAEEMPELVGGLQALQSGLRYPEVARRAGIEGRVIVQFVVDAQGRVVDPRVVKGLGSGLDEEALRVVREATFTPGRQHGKAMPIRMALPITFQLP